MAYFQQRRWGREKCWFSLTSLKFELQNYRSYRDFFHDILEQLKTNIHTNVKSITFMFMSSLRDKFMLLLQNTAADVSVFFRLPCWYPSGWAPAWRPHKPLLITFPSDSSYTKYSSDLNLGEGLCISGTV